MAIDMLAVSKCGFRWEYFPVLPTANGLLIFFGWLNDFKALSINFPLLWLPWVLQIDGA